MKTEMFVIEMKQEQTILKQSHLMVKLLSPLSKNPKKSVSKYKPNRFKINQSNIPSCTKACCHLTSFLTLDETILE